MEPIGILRTNDIRKEKSILAKRIEKEQKNPLYLSIHAQDPKFQIVTEKRQLAKIFKKKRKENSLPICHIVFKLKN
jgi:hypothetical protein